MGVDDFRATVNRAYYATFYAANAMLLTKGLERRKYSGVLSAFREHFVKPGLIETEHSSFYGEALVIREDADYAVEIPIDLDMAETALRQARRFVQRMRDYLVCYRTLFKGKNVETRKARKSGTKDTKGPGERDESRSITLQAIYQAIFAHVV